MAYEVCTGAGRIEGYYLGLSSDLDASVQRFAIVPYNDARCLMIERLPGGANGGLSVGETIE